MAQENMVQDNGRDPAPAISVIVPVRNEAGNIAPLVAEIAAALQSRVFEIVYVNDGSADATEEELRGLVYSLTPRVIDADEPWYKRPGVLACIVGAFVIILNVIFW